MSTIIWEYRLEPALDFLNRNGSGIQRVNELSLDEWEPCMVIKEDALGYRTTMLFRRPRK